ncbi:hypothetical protein KYC5002_40430 [Archangium violaceum]|uniref:hypothetical protein n=1 Tax=Archangium violaceum TaxID=83451 RepID=UPI002B28B8B1|nr:hypothetical protein KYC5002_40430 [Archangium gephyra]
MQANPFRSFPCALLCGLLLVACNAPLDDESGAEESLGTQESALCTGLSVTSLPISGASTYQGEMAASGSWVVSSGANAVRLEYYVDNALYASEERPGASGTWYFSRSGITCGTHTFKVIAWPMVIDSSGVRTTCYVGSNTASHDASAAPCCVPRTCASAGATCGTLSNGCGGTLSCGGCSGSGRKCFEGTDWYYAGVSCVNNKCVSNSCDF